MDNPPANRCIYEFGAFSLDAAQCVLRRGGETVALTPKAFETLLVLVRNGGRIVQKQELLSAIWPDTFVEESNLTFNISVLRKTLNEGEEPGGDGVRYIETVPKRGYRFVAPVREIQDAAAAATTLTGRSQAVEISGNGEANAIGTSAVSASKSSLNNNASHKAHVSPNLRRAGDAAIIPQSVLETTGEHSETRIVAATTTEAAAVQGWRMPRWLLAAVPLCLLLAGVGAWQQRQQKNHARQEASNATSSIA